MTFGGSGRSKAKCKSAAALTGQRRFRFQDDCGHAKRSQSASARRDAALCFFQVAISFWKGASAHLGHRRWR